MPEMITEQDARYALKLVKAICTQAGPGLAGSLQEHRRAAMIQRELESHLGAGNVAVEEFSLAPWAFVGAYPLCGLLMLLAALLNISLGRLAGVPPWLTASAALAFAILAPVVYIVEFVLGVELVDPLYKKQQSLNVIGALRKPGSVSVKRLLILSGHHDSAAENTWLRLLGPGFFFLSAAFFIAIFVLLAVCMLQLAGVIIGDDVLARLGTLGWVLLVFPLAPAVIYALFFTRGKKNGGSVPGAADNLSACALAVALCRFLMKNPEYIPDDTEIRFITFGSEEAGYRGARRYVKRHQDELDRLQARLLNIETIAHPEMVILTSDLNGVVKNSPQMVQSLVAAAERAGVPYKLQPALLGVANDSGPFSQAGIQAATLLAFKVPQQMVAFYHQDRDTPEVLTTEPLFNALRLAFEWVHAGGEAVIPR
jgi:hypothetical protein